MNLFTRSFCPIRLQEITTFPNFCNKILHHSMSRLILTLTSISSNKIIELLKYFICGHSSQVIPLIETIHFYLSHTEFWQTRILIIDRWGSVLRSYLGLIFSCSLGWPGQVITSHWWCVSFIASFLRIPKMWQRFLSLLDKNFNIGQLIIVICRSLSPIGYCYL